MIKSEREFNKAVRSPATASFSTAQPLGPVRWGGISLVFKNGSITLEKLAVAFFAKAFLQGISRRLMVVV
jgi:hypothetical protein